MSRLIVIVVILIVLATQHHCSAFRSRGSSWRSIRLRELAIHAAPSSAELRREKQQSSKTAKTVLNRANDIADNDLSDGDIESSLHDKKVNLLAFLPIPALLFGGYELANAGNIIIDPSQASVVGSYWRYFLAGAISCSFSHLVTVPFDVVKTRIQLETEKIGIMDMGKRLAAEEGISSFLTGAGPTVSGYFVQGAMKYGFFEVFKPAVRHYFEYQNVQLDNIVILMIAAGMAELIGSSFLTPFEAARIRLVAKPDFADNIFDCLSKQLREEGLISWFLGLPAVTLKNVPYTVMQLSVFESLSKAAYDTMDGMGMSAAEAYDLRYAVTFSTALIAAVLAGVASQPGDTLLSMVNKRSSENVALATAGASFTPPKSSESPDFVPPSFSAAAAAASKDADLQPSAVENNPLVIMSEAAQELGVSGLFKGMTARLFHVSFIIVVQLLLYDVIKQLCGIPVTGMHH